MTILYLNCTHSINNSTSTHHTVDSTFYKAVSKHWHKCKWNPIQIDDFALCLPAFLCFCEMACWWLLWPKLVATNAINILLWPIEYTYNLFYQSRNRVKIGLNVLKGLIILSRYKRVLVLTERCNVMVNS